MSTKWINVNGGDWNTAANWDNGVPSPTSQAIFDAASFAANGKIITASALMQCQGLDVSAADQTFTIQSAVYGLELYGNFVGSTNCTFAMTGTAYVYSKATMTLTTNGKSLAWNRWFIDTVGGTVTNGDAMNIGASTLILANGTWNSNNKDIIGGRVSSITGTKNATLGSSILTFYDWIISTSLFNMGTSTIILTNETQLGTIAGSNFYNLTLNGLANINAGFNIFNNVVVSNDFIIAGKNSTSHRALIKSDTIGTPRTITCNGTTNITNCDFQDITFAGTANRDFSAQTDIGNCGGNSGITFPPAIDCYIKHTSGAMSVSNVAKWVTTDGGSTQARVPLPQDRAWGTANSFTGASTVTMDCPRIGSIDLSGVSQAVNWTLANAISVYKSYRMGTNITQLGNFAISYLGDRSTNGTVYLGSNHPNNFNVILSNTFVKYTIEKGQKVRFTAGTIQSSSMIPDIYGTAAAPITIQGVTAAEFTLNYTGSQWVQCDWLNLTNSKVLPVNRWFAGRNSVNGGGNTNWLFKRYIMTPIITLIRRI